MSDEIVRAEIARRKVAYELVGADAATVRRNVPCPVGDGHTLAVDVYHPAGWSSGRPAPVVLFVNGYSDAGMEKILGCKAKEMESYVSWGRLVAASGLVGVTYTTSRPATDALAVLRWLRDHAETLAVDPHRVGVWACSGNVPNALSLLMEEGTGTIRCAALCYGYMLDFDGFTGVADAAGTFRFVNPGAGKSVADLPADLPLFIVRAGRDDMPHLNESIDRFVDRARALNLPVTLVNHPDGPHAFDLFHDGAATRLVIGQLLQFLREHLSDA